MKYDIMYQHSPEYKLILKHYGDKTAERSKVPIIRHIHEGCHILQLRKQELWTQRAFCLHPIFQDDDAFADIGLEYIQHTGADYSVTCALEYRGIANSYLSKHTNSNRLVIYFHEWLEVLKVTESQYKKYVKELNSLVMETENV